MFSILVEFASLKCLSHEVVEGKYKVKMTFIVGKGKNNQNIVMTAKIMKVDEGKVCLDVQRVDGDVFAFHYSFKEIKDYLGELIDATY